MFDGPLILWLHWTIVGIIPLESDKFVMGVDIKATDDSKLNDSPGCIYLGWGEGSL